MATLNPFMRNDKKLDKYTSKILRCEKRNILKVCLIIFHYYAEMLKSSQTFGQSF